MAMFPISPTAPYHNGEIYLGAYVLPFGYVSPSPDCKFHIDWDFPDFCAMFVVLSSFQEGVSESYLLNEYNKTQILLLICTTQITLEETFTSLLLCHRFPLWVCITPNLTQRKELTGRVVAPEILFHHRNCISWVTVHLEILPWITTGFPTESFGFLLRPWGDTGKLPHGPHWFDSLFFLEP